MLGVSSLQGSTGEVSKRQKVGSESSAPSAELQGSTGEVPKRQKVGSESSAPSVELWNHLPIDLRRRIYNEQDTLARVLLGSTCKAESDELKTEWIEQKQNKVKDAAGKIFNLVNNENPTIFAKRIQSCLVEKFGRISPPLQFSDVKNISSFKKDTKRYIEQLGRYNFLTEFEDELSNEDLWDKINIILEALAYKVDKKIVFYTFCLSFNKLAENAARALENLAIYSYNQQAIVEAGAIAPLVKLLTDGTDTQKENAARVLRNLAENNKVAIVNAGAIDPLVKLLDGTDRQKEYAAEALWELSEKNHDNQVAIVNAGAIDPLVELVRSGTDDQQANAAGTFLALAENNHDNQVVIVNAGAIDLLVELVRSGTDPQQTNAAGALWSLAKNNHDNQVAIAKAGAIVPLVTILKTGTAFQKQNAADALKNLAEDNPDNQNAIVEAGAIKPLMEYVKLFGEGDNVRALENLAANNPGNQKG